MSGRWCTQHLPAAHNVVVYIFSGGYRSPPYALWNFPSLHFVISHIVIISAGIFLTVDSVRFGYREADARNGWNSLPPPHRLANYDEEVTGETGSREERLTSSTSSDSVIDKSKIYDGEEGARMINGNLIRLLLYSI
jgi:hypothetical protein